MEINLVSDTVTHTKCCSICSTPSGDDVYKQDPTVIELESSLADMFGMEAALFFLSEQWQSNRFKVAYTQPENKL
jgi:threonine aldolase